MTTKPTLPRRCRKADKLADRDSFKLRRTLDVDTNARRLHAHCERLRRSADAQRMHRWLRLTQRFGHRATGSARHA